MADESLPEGLRRCGNCHWRRVPDIKDIQAGVCRSRPPQIVAIPNAQGIMLRPMHPPVAPNDPWCGDWKLKAGAAAAELDRTQGQG